MTVPGTQMRWQAEALFALQEAAEAHIVAVFADRCFVVRIRLHNIVYDCFC